MIRGIPGGEVVMIGVDSNGNVGEGNVCDEEIQRSGQMIEDFTKAMKMNTFPTKDEHLSLEGAQKLITSL